MSKTSDATFIVIKEDEPLPRRDYNLSPRRYTVRYGDGASRGEIAESAGGFDFADINRLMKMGLMLTHIPREPNGGDYSLMDGAIGLTVMLG